MAVTFALVESTPFRLRYLATRDTGAGDSANIPNDAGATPDLRTDLDAAAGPLRTIMRAGVDGLGTVAAGAMTQAQARAALLSDNTGSIGNDLVPRAIVTLLDHASAVGNIGDWRVDANVDGQGDPILTVTCTAGLATRQCYVDIHARHSFDR